MDAGQADEAPILVERSGHIATITLNSPERLNALSTATHVALGDAWDDLGADPEIRVVVFTGAGRGFCAGGDANLLSEVAEDPNSPTASVMPKFTPRQKEFYKPVIVAVNGVCAGAGFHFVNDASIVIASDRAEFLDTHVNIGHVDALEPVGLLRRIPLERVLRMVVLGRAERLDAHTAKEVGIVSEVLAHEQLMARAYELAGIAAQGSPATMQASLRAIWESFDYSLTDAYERGFEMCVEHRQSHPDAAEGPKAFREKRPPVWTA